MADKEFVYKITGQTDNTAADKTRQSIKGIKQETDEAGKSATGFGNIFSGSMAGLIAKITGVVIAFKALKSIVRDTKELLDAFGKQQTIDFKQEAILKATGNAAGFSAAQLKLMAAELSNLTKVSDEEITAAQNMLLTFKSIRGGIFTDAMKSVLDMATLFGGAESAAIQLGKALEDPTVGLSALSRIGVTFTEQQKEQIHNYQDQNDLISAQTIIMDALKGQINGVAEASAKGYEGSKKGIVNAFADMKQALGALIERNIPVISAMAAVERSLRFVEKSADTGKLKIDGFAGSLDKLKDYSNAGLVSVIEDIDKATIALEDATKEADKFRTAMDSIKSAEMAKKLAEIDLLIATGEISPEEGNFSKQEIRATFEQRELLGKKQSVISEKESITGKIAQLESALAKATDAFQSARDPYEALRQDALGNFGSGDELIARLDAVTRERESIWFGGDKRIPQLDQEKADLTKRFSILKDLEKQTPGIESARTNVEEIARNLANTKKTGRDRLITLDAQEQALNIQIETNDIMSRSSDEARKTAREEKRRKEAEEREAKMTPEQLMDRMQENIANAAVGAQGQIYEGGTIGEATQAKAREALKIAGELIKAGENDQEVFNKLVNTMNRLGAVVIGGFGQMAKDIDRLDGVTGEIKTIIKASRQ